MNTIWEYLSFAVHTFLLAIFVLLSSASDSRAGSMDSLNITQLSYQPLNTHSGLYHAQDSSGDTWVRGHIADSLLHHIVLFQNRSIHIMDYDLYAYEDGQLIRLKKNVDRNGLQVKTRYPVYYYIPSATEYYINIRKSDPHELQLFTNEIGRFGQSASLIILYFSMYYGLAIMVILFNVVFYLIFTDLRFITYALLQLSIFLTFFYEDGMLYYFSNQEWILPYFSIWNTSASCVLAAIFTYYFLDLKQHIPFFGKLITIAGISLLATASLYSYSDWWGFNLISLLIRFALPAFCFYQASKLFKTNPYARFLLINFGLLVFVGIGYALYRRYDLNFLSIFNIHTLRLASAIEIVAISFALIFKVRTIREENARYKTELRHYLSLLRLDKELEYEKNKQETSTYTRSAPTDRDQFMLEEIQTQFQLTEREVEVLHHIWKGDSNKEIAEKLCISVHTVKYHVGKLYVKLDVSTRSEVRSLKP
ncbi:LuxR C-terminal-related transcriptional regulator [Sphingobacterium sp. UT-1RO-CII-1]|uniref:LuxR C-terminal-related transcriptional regulator n=1 Tax=Sphingobacterium sp. UT-1RO-CII-1 TaxID=2995225 RepID=UPI00227BFC38|nr:LuxR C-terminal-related transcriptional regulator [Sphingobacterium sp. UT-1RO-CII-1]MCY4779341.1 LuxR C-terminal-related transcriptional regulator [Sphingobacterium sp. UT-1RO-CII-1]